MKPCHRPALALIAGAALIGGCSQVRDRQGFRMDPVLVQSVQPGVDNRDSVTRTLGRPSFVGQFDQRDWYYVSRSTRQLAFASPRPMDQTILHVRFDAAGNVETVKQTGLETIASITPTDRETPTLGRDRGFFRELFGNIGAGAGAPGANTADNPN